MDMESFMKHSRLTVLIAVATISILSAGCAKKNVAAQPPRPPEPVAASAPPAPAAAPVSRAAAPAAAPAKPPASSRYPDAITRARIDELLARIEDAYFDYDKHTLRPDAIQALQSDSRELRDILKDYPDYKLTIEGHCDERGSAEYNIALGEARAEAAKNYLVQVGIPAGQLALLSYGKERPVCSDHDESCWQKNRRIHIVAAMK